MKKILLLSVIASTMIMAGGDIAPVEEPVVIEPVVTDGGLYLGLAYGYMGEEYTRTPTEFDPRNFDESQSSIMIQAGYKFNAYVAVEGRYWFGIDDLDVVNANGETYTLDGADAWGLYVKPMYPVTDEFDVYALLGYAAAEHNSVKLNNVDGFSWGLGASYEFTDSVAMFVDYVSIYNDDRDLPAGLVNKEYIIDTINIGVTYNF